LSFSSTQFAAGVRHAGRELRMFGRRKDMRTVISTYTAAVSLVLAAAAFAGSDSVFKDRNGEAIRGYDPVAYFTDHRPVRGSDQFTYTWMDATWKFASAADRDKFIAAPTRYAPQYGGYCAYGMSQGHKAPVDPEAWRIVDGKLYLNYSRNVKTDWEKDVTGNVRKADSNWMKLGK
jgi:hypothetical protein